MNRPAFPRLRLRTPLLAALLAALLFAPACFADLEYEKDIMPIFMKKCAECHSQKEGKVKGGLRLDDPAHFHGRFEKNGVVVPGDWDASYLFITLFRPADHEDAMPPKGKGERLTEEEVQLVQRWIAEGAAINGTRGPTGPMPESDAAMVADLGGNPLTRPARPQPVEQDWTNVDGVTIRATLLKVEGDHAYLRAANGAVYRYPVAKLSPESQALLRPQ